MELDDLKSAWKSIPDEKKYDRDKIFNMLKKKSTSTIQWFFKFTLTELTLVVLFTLISIAKGKLITGESLSFENSFFYRNYIIGSACTILFTLLFLIYSYNTYQKIKINDSVKNLMNHIIRYRKIVNFFIFFQVIALISISTPYYFELGKNIYIDKIGSNYDINKADTVGYIAVGIAIVLILIITTIYYGVIYWLFLRKLSKNLYELKDIK